MSNGLCPTLQCAVKAKGLGFNGVRLLYKAINIPRIFKQMHQTSHIRRLFIAKGEDREHREIIANRYIALTMAALPTVL